jgi:hypothetical protein
MVLSDGKTYSALKDCRIVEVADRAYDDLDAVVEAIAEDGVTVDGHIVSRFTGGYMVTP